MVINTAVQKHNSEIIKNAKISYCVNLLAVVAVYAKKTRILTKKDESHSPCSLHPGRYRVDQRRHRRRPSGRPPRRPRPPWRPQRRCANWPCYCSDCGDAHALHLDSQTHWIYNWQTGPLCAPHGHGRPHGRLPGELPLGQPRHCGLPPWWPTSSRPHCGPRLPPLMIDDLRFDACDWSGGGGDRD